MAKLRFSLEGKQLAEYTIDKERMTIGRRPSCDVHIDNMAVSGQHAAIITIGNDSFLEDMDSTNGTKVNGKPIKKYVLHHGDQIELGKYQLTYINEDQPSLESALTKVPLDKVTAFMQPPKSNPQEPQFAGKPDVEATQPIMLKNFGHLKVIDGDDAGKEILLNRALLTLGKSTTQVAVLTKRPEGYFLTHVEGENMPTVNDKPIGVQAHQLADQDIIEVGGVKMRFYTH